MAKYLLYEKYHSKRNLQKRIIGDNNFTYKYLIYFIKKYTNRKMKILDIGCGVGTIDLYLAKMGNKVFGLDVSKKGIVIARRNARNFGFSKILKFDVINFPNIYPKGKFDLVICSEVLEHIKQDKMAVLKIKSLLGKNGLVIASSPSQKAPLFRWGLLTEFDKNVGHLRRYTKVGFEKLFENAGFKILEIRKTEGVVRNFLFTNSFGGFMLRILNKWPFSELVTFIDNLFIPVFGESNFYLVAQKQ